MKRVISLLIVLMIALSLCACDLDFSSQIESISDSIFNQIVDVGGGLLKEDTSSNDDYNYDHELLETDTSTDTETDTETETETDTETTPDTPDVPDVPVEPEKPALVLYERTRVALHNYIALNLTNANHKAPIKAYGGARLYRDFATLANDSDAYAFFSINGVAPIIHLDAQISDASDDTILSYASKLNAFALAFGTTAFYNVTHVEIGTEPDSSISAQDYARLLNACYDGANDTLGEGYGIAEHNPKIKIISGQLTSIQTQYIKDVMTEIGNLRTDGFLPIGGWSINYVTGNTPERGYLNNNPLKSLVEYRDRYYPNMELHLNSFAWDTVNTESSNFVNGYSVYSSEEMQCAYILRTYMILNSMGIDRATIKTYQDTEDDCSGIVTKDGEKKVAYGGLETFKGVAYGMYFKEALINGENDTYVYLFEDANGKQLIGAWTALGTAEYTPSSACTVYTYDQASKSFTSADNSSSAITLTAMPTFIVTG